MSKREYSVMRNGTEHAVITASSIKEARQRVAQAYAKPHITVIRKLK